MRRSNEPLWWVPFAGGMMLDALTVPALLLITGILVPFGLIPPDQFHRVLNQPLIRFLLFVLIAATFFHAAHRLRFALVDLGLKPLKPVLPVLLYGGAILGALFAGIVSFGTR